MIIHVTNDAAELTATTRDLNLSQWEILTAGVRNPYSRGQESLQQEKIGIFGSILMPWIAQRYNILTTYFRMPRIQNWFSVYCGGTWIHTYLWHHFTEETEW